MPTRSVATVFGGSGFIGRYVVKRLAAAGHVVRVAGRDTERAKDLMVTGRVGQVVPLYVSLSNEGTVLRAVEGADRPIGAVREHDVEGGDVRRGLPVDARALP